MQETGTRNPSTGAAAYGLDGSGIVFWNLAEPALYERSIARGEARLAASGALCVDTAPLASAAPADRRVVREDASAPEGWEGHRPLEREAFDRLKADMLAHAAGRSIFAQDLHAGADADWRLNLRAYCEQAWHGLFLRTLLRRPARETLATFVPDLTLLCLPGFKADPERHGFTGPAAVAIDLARGDILVCGTNEGAELRNAVQLCLDHALPGRGVLPLHGAVTVSEEGEAALLLGHDGSGKTTLAADEGRTLIGDDSHGWAASGLVNLEGGCHVRTEGLSAERAPELHAAVNRFGTLLENVVLHPDTREPNYASTALGETPRASFPLRVVPHASLSGRAPAPRAILLLCRDTRGVLPPIARLKPATALYHFLSGYGAPMAAADGAPAHAGFSPCFAGATLAHHPSTHAARLRDLVQRHGATCWLVNTGWIGGPMGTGRRVPLALTRRLVAAAIDGALAEVDMRTDPYFGISVPTSLPGVEPQLLNPARSWASASAYEAAARALVALFVENFERFETAVDDEVRGACPRLAVAAE
ncbi:phosphoenolpyruvate carboxykinase (ATP) [Ancylobacter lacus]|uniref:phosphoenolpyruvate carboxykinase (ATP) n=1 Tax=Ancylobacter lacus TaxID=2579970 RepID=UPI001BCB639D|nr:phosphoenolpyruvate carboxykinase (ATP) [Ancylobacter lacus]MBS7538788.1 phosphoenolpyruvate carboxykinase (ATP) [Ancylobacter lacus]